MDSQPDSLDEMVGGDRQVRPAWRPLFVALSELGSEALVERKHLLARAAEEQGGTSLAAAEDGPIFLCDAVPLILSGTEFGELERGLGQRARLFQALLADLYGPMRTLEAGLLDPGLVYADPRFMRARRDRAAEPGATQISMLQFYAADLVRGSDRVWRVVADRIADPAGIGYVRESRRLMKRVMPEGFRAQPVRNLRPFFDLHQDALVRLAGGTGAGNPGVAILTPGTADPTWFEHMLMARELSCALVEPGDLTVRQGEVFLKTLRGLQRIEVLVSRVPSVVTDPLELPSRGLPGVTGLMDALRHSRVIIINDPGAALAEAEGLAALLPALAEPLLGEPLSLAQDLVRRAPSDGSVAPTVTPTGLEPRPFSLRLFLMFDGRRWHTLPGGLARVMARSGTADPEARLIKDVWIVDREQADIIGPSITPQPRLPVRRGTGDLPGRIADGFFWLGRYLERLEAAARLIRITVSRLGREASLARDAAVIETLTDCLIHSDLLDPETSAALGSDAVVAGLVGSGRPGGAVHDLVTEVTRLTDVLRDRLTADMYGVFIQAMKEVVEDLHSLNQVPRWRRLDHLSHSMIAILRFSATVSGLSAENMVQGGGRLFLDLGRRLERSHNIAMMIGTVLERAARPTRIGLVEDWLRLILELADSTITYRSRYLTVLQPAPVLDLVLADSANPRALAFQLEAMRRHLSDVEGGQEGVLMLACDRLEHELQALGAAETKDLDVVSAGSLAQRLFALSKGCAGLSDAVARRYFSLLPPRQALGTGLKPAEIRGAA